MPKSPFFRSQEQFDEAQRALGVEPLASPNKSSSHPKNSSSHAKTPKKKPVDRDKAWLDTNDEVQRSRRDAEEQDKNKTRPHLYHRFPNKSPKAT
jgi:hypothetical protein